MPTLAKPTQGGTFVKPNVLGKKIKKWIEPQQMLYKAICINFIKQFMKFLLAVVLKY